MGIADWFRRKTDRVDGYSPPSPPTNDPWSTPEALEQMRAQAGDEHADGFSNELTGIGHWIRDKTFGGLEGGPAFQVRLLAGIECENRWRGSDLGGRIVETIPDEMTREGWDLTIQASDDDRKDAFPMPGAAPDEPKHIPLPEVDDEGAEAVEQLQGELERLCWDDAAWKALCYERAFGGGAILVGADDGFPLSSPLDESKIASVRHLNAFRGGWDGELVAWSYYRDPSQPKYGQPEMYMLRNLGVPLSSNPVPGAAPMQGQAAMGTQIQWVHESRLLVFGGTPVSRDACVQMRGWGDSIFTRVDEVLSQFSQTWGGVAILMQDFSQFVLSIENLTQTLGANNKNGTKALQNRALALQMSRSISRALLIDSKEKAERQTASLAGIADVLQQFSLRLAAAADMPVALLMGQAPAGLNATGASDIRFFYDRVRSKQVKRVAPNLRRLLKLIMLAKQGPTRGTEPNRWSVTPRPLYQMTAVEKADLRLKGSQADDLDIKNQILTPEEAAASAYGGSLYGTDRRLDLAGRRAMVDLDIKDRDARATQMVEQSKGEPGTVAPGATPQGIQPLELTPTQQGAIVTVNQALARLGLPPWPDKEGNLTIAEFSAAHSGVIAEAANATAGDEGKKPKPFPPPEDE